MKLRSREPYWLLKDGLIKSYPSLNKNIECEILIIGAGITGALMAYQLTQEGYNTIIIDKRDIGMGSTAATTALLQYEIDEPLSTLRQKVGNEAAIDSYREGIIAINQLEQITKTIKSTCSFNKKQSLHFAAKSAHKKWLKEEYEVRLFHDFDVEWISQERLREIYGLVSPGAILSKSGASVDAYQLTHDILHYCESNHGLQIYDHTEAMKISHESNKSIIHTDTNRKINCKNIIFTTGYESTSILNEKIVDLNSTYAFVSEPLAQLPSAFNQTIFWNTEKPYLYLRGTPDNRILVGGGDEKFKDALRRDRLIEKKEHFLFKQVKKAFPSLSIVPDLSWAGTFGVTKNALPFIGKHKKHPRSYFVLGFGGNGITFSIMGMKIISDLLKDRSNKFANYYQFDR